MVAINFAPSLAYVWRMENDSPRQGTHTEKGDPGGQTRGGVIAETWRHAVGAGIVQGDLAHASDEQLRTVLHSVCWGPTCDVLPPGLDLLVFNGRMLSGHFTHLFQQAVGFLGDDVDGDIGPVTLAAVRQRDADTLIYAVTGAHHAYLTGLPTWQRFGRGWARRLMGARAAALALVHVGELPPLPDAGKVKLGAYAPTLPVADAGKVRQA